MFLPENGLTSNESGTYSNQFLRRFFKEQAERNRDLLEVAQDLLRAKRLSKGTAHSKDPLTSWPNGSAEIQNNPIKQMGVVA